RGYNVTEDPAVAFDADGTAYLANIATNASEGPVGKTNYDIIVSPSSDGGPMWSDPVVVARGIGTDLGFFRGRTIFNDKPYVAAWGHGNAIVTWTQFGLSPEGGFLGAPILASVTHDGGRNWTAPAQISGSLFSNQDSVPTIAADGSIYV